MINSAVINNQNQVIGSIVNDIYLLPKWEILTYFSIVESKYYFFKKVVKLNILRKFSALNMTEKYSIRTIEGKVIANMDLKTYKDSVYIINLEVLSKKGAFEAIRKLLQISVEKAIYNTTKKFVFHNLPVDDKNVSFIKKILLSNGFKIDENQSQYEKKLLGESYRLCADDCCYFYDDIIQSPILINK